MRPSFPWARLMAIGFGVLRLPPRDFWAATPREIAAAFPGSRPEMLPRDRLDTLMKQFPDDA